MSLQQSSEYFNYLYGTSWWVNLAANISKSANCCLLDRAFVCGSFAQFPWTTLCISANQPSIKTLQTSKCPALAAAIKGVTPISGSGILRSALAWQKHTSTWQWKCHTNHTNHEYMFFSALASIWISVQVFLQTLTKTITILQKKISNFISVSSYVIFRKHPEKPCPHVPWSARPPLPNSLAHTGEPNILRPTSDHRSQAPATFQNEMEGWNPSVAKEYE